MDRKQVGRVGLSSAINYFTINGYTVSIPLNDTQWYDLIIEKDGIFKTVQCKGTSTEDSTIDFRSTGGTNGGVYDNILNHPLDYLFCIDKDLKCWLIPVEDIRKSGLSRSLVLRDALPFNSHPKLDTTKYVIK